MSEESVWNERIKSAYDRMGYTTEAFGEKIGCTRQCAGYYVTGKRQPKVTYLYKIAKALNTSPNYLVGFTDNPDPEEGLCADSLHLSQKAVDMLYEYPEFGALVSALAENESLPEFADLWTWSCVYMLESANKLLQMLKEAET